MAQQEGERILERAPWVDFVMGPGNVGHLDEVLERRATRVAVDFPEDRRYDDLAIDRASATKARVTIIEGCNKNCTFCIVPTTRGREVSRPFDDVLAEVRAAVASGRVEIELLGQTVNAYRCPRTGRDFGALLGAVAELDGVARLRFMTSHPAEVNDSMIAAMRDHENISRYLHLPVQSGSSKILRRMKRLYTREKYLEIDRAHPRGDPGDPLLDRRHRRLPRRDGGGLPGDALARSRRCATARCSRSSTRRGRERRR